MITYIDIGTIIRLPEYKGYWKIKNQRKELGSEYVSYSVIKCTKTGKEFTQVNGFGVDYVHKNAEIVYVPNGKMTDLEPEKVSRNGIEITKLKNRKRYLENVIREFSKELVEVNKKLENY